MNDHSIVVGKIMQQLALEKTGDKDYANEMFILGYLHDIGKQFGYTINHAEKGGELLHKSQYKYRKEVYYHGSIDCMYHSNELDLLNIADLQVLQDGTQVTVRKRLNDIGERYGRESNTYKKCIHLAINLNLL